MINLACSSSIEKRIIFLIIFFMSSTTSCRPSYPYFNDVSVESSSAWTEAKWRESGMPSPSSVRPSKYYLAMLTKTQDQKLLWKIWNKGSIQPKSLSPTFRWYLVRFDLPHDPDPSALAQRLGVMPLPPYVRRPASPQMKNSINCICKGGKRGGSSSCRSPFHS